MSMAITFDPLKYANRLKTAGVPDRQAEAMAEAQAEVFDRNLEERVPRGDLKKLEEAARRDLNELELRLTAEIAPLKWGMVPCMAGVMTLIVKTFFARQADVVGQARFFSTFRDRTCRVN
nr:Phage-related protein [uncultured bacterium]